ncbi:MAG: type II toxin-antitoxin system RelE/ParE family toxin [Deltaproteobacteria bacterium]|nr:MAG: type II toxin-antitoxin system RelE/ParE family toxin [Deltaproteobacteria bacterium]
MSWKIVYYSEVVRQWVDGLPPDLRAYYARITERMLKHGPYLRMPYVRPLGQGLNEIRAIGKEGIARVFFAARSEQIVILHGFVKKTERTLKRELDTARRRLKEIGDENA